LEQVARRTLSLLLKSKTSHLLDRSVLFPGTSIYFYTRLGRKTSWESGFVFQALPEYVGVLRHLGSRGAILKIAYEDIRLAPSSSILKELDALEHNCDASKDFDMGGPSPKQNFSSFLTSTASAPIDAPDKSTKDVGPVALSVAQTLEPTTLDRKLTDTTASFHKII
jgi:hypothetical protein